MKLNKYILAAIWLGMFILCAVLGYLPPQEGANKWMLAIFALLFFLPPALLVYLGWTEKDQKLVKILQTFSHLYNFLISSSSTSMSLFSGTFL